MRAYYNELYIGLSANFFICFKHIKDEIYITLHNELFFSDKEIFWNYDDPNAFKEKIKLLLLFK